MLFEKAMEELKNRGYDVREETVNKNGVEYRGIMIRAGYASPIIYPQNYDTPSELIEACEDALKKGKELQEQVDVLNLLENVKIGLAKEVDESIIQRKKKFHGMIQYLYFNLGYAIAKIPRTILDNYSERELWNAAKANTFAETKIFGSSAIFGGPDLFKIVTNTSGYLGASSILNTDAIREQIGAGKYYVCPSSVHEMLLIPYNTFNDVKGVSEMVAAVNADVVDPKDRLVDKAFILEV